VHHVSKSVLIEEEALDEDEIRRFVESEYARVVNAVALVCDSRAAAEDAVEEALARAWLRLRRGQSIDSLVAWVTAVAMNEARGGVRRRMAEARAQRRLAEQATLAAPDDASAGARAHEVRAALRLLPRRQREVTVLRYFLRFTIAEIAESLDVDQGTVKTSLHRARRTLAAALGEPDATKEPSCA
jgi:RNA polymerase sigma-70 factor (ECF subfamily)